MSAPQDESAVPEVRFKRRKIAHKKRAPTQDEAVTALVSKSPEAESIDNAPTLLNHDEDDAESVANLQKIIRNRRRPRDRFKESARKPEPRSTEIVPVEVPRADQYTSRFVAQTGQIVDRDDKQMTEYVEARMAEQNYRQYGWPIPRHLQIAVAAIAPDLKHTFTGGTSAHKTAHGSESVADVQHSQRQAVGQGKLQEVDLGPDAAARIEKDWKRLDAGEPEEESTSKARKSKYGYQWRRAKRRNSDAERRDKMVEAVLKEAKLDYFDETVPTNPRFQASGTNNDDEVAERFRAEYFEAMEEQQHRKAPPPASGAKGAKEASKGPKLGGSKSARAKMRLQEEQAAKTKR